MIGNHLYLVFSENDLCVSYISQGEEMLRYTFPYGYLFLESKGLGPFAISSLESAVISVLEQVSLYDRVPKAYLVHSYYHKAWIKGLLESLSYAQFFTPEKEVHVTLLDTRATKPAYARHQETLQSFKV
jgi:hypothetical protein